MVRSGASRLTEAGALGWNLEQTENSPRQLDGNTINGDQCRILAVFEQFGGAAIVERNNAFAKSHSFEQTVGEV